MVLELLSSSLQLELSAISCIFFSRIFIKIHSPSRATIFKFNKYWYANWLTHLIGRNYREKWQIIMPKSEIASHQFRICFTSALSLKPMQKLKLPWTHNFIFNYDRNMLSRYQSMCKGLWRRGTLATENLFYDYIPMTSKCLCFKRLPQTFS